MTDLKHGIIYSVGKIQPLINVQLWDGGIVIAGQWKWQHGSWYQKTLTSWFQDRLVKPSHFTLYPLCEKKPASWDSYLNSSGEFVLLTNIMGGNRQISPDFCVEGLATAKALRKFLSFHLGEDEEQDEESVHSCIDVVSRDIISIADTVKIAYSYEELAKIIDPDSFPDGHDSTFADDRSIKALKAAIRLSDAGFVKVLVEDYNRFFKTGE